MKTRNPILQNMALNGSLIYNFSAFLFAAIVAILFTFGMEYKILGLKAEEQMMILLSIGFVVAMIQIITPTYKDKNKGEPNQFYFDINILCFAWLLFGIFYDKDFVILLNVINISISTFVLTYKRGWDGIKVTWPFLIAVIISLSFREGLYNLAQPKMFTLILDWNLAKITEATASVIEILPFYRKWQRQKNHQEYITDSVQGFVEIVLLYMGWLCWHVVTNTFVAATIISFTVVLIIVNIYYDAYQPKLKKST